MGCGHGKDPGAWCDGCGDFVPPGFGLSPLHMMALAVGLLVGACLPVNPPTPGPGGEGCAAACANLDRLGCPWRTAVGPDDRAGTADDIPCERWCADYEFEGVDLHTGCVAGAASCEAADACGSGL